MYPFVYLGYAFGWFKTPKQGAETSIFLAETDDYESGHYWHNKKHIPANPIAHDQDYAKALWSWSCRSINA